MRIEGGTYIVKIMGWNAAAAQISSFSLSESTIKALLYKEKRWMSFLRMIS